MIQRLFYSALFIVMISCSNSNNDHILNLTGDYLGQDLPGDSAILFASGIVSSGLADRDIAITPEGDELFFTRTAKGFEYSTIFYTKRVSDNWTKPEVFKFCTDGRYKYTEPFINFDGTKLYFVSNKPLNGTEPASFDIWVSEKNDGNWTEPYNLGEPVNTSQNEFFPTLTKDGTIYFNHIDSVLQDEFIYRSKLLNGKYTTPEKLPAQVNGGRARFNAFISPDESFIIIPTFGLPDSHGATDYYIVFRNENDEWSQPINMGNQVNSANGQEWSASISPDGKFLFFMSARIPKEERTSILSADLFNQLHNAPQNGNSDIYWIKADFIEELRKQAVFEDIR